MQALKYFRVLLTLVAATGATSVTAQTYPARPVTFIVPYAAGAGAISIETQLYAQKLADAMGQPFLVDYRPGAGTMIGSAYVAKAPPDGYTLLSQTGSFNTVPALYKNLPYDSLKDLTPVSLMGKRTTVIAASPLAPFRTIKEYIEYTRAHPGEINIATPGSGSSPHLNAAWFHSLVGTKVAYIQYKVTSNLIADLIAGRVHVTYTTLGSVLPLIKSGKLRLLGIGNAERSPVLPDALPAAQQGVPDYDYSSISFILAPGKTPATIVNRLSTELAKIAKDPEVVQKLGGDGAVIVGSTPEQLGKVLVAEITRFEKLVQETGIKLEE